MSQLRPGDSKKCWRLRPGTARLFGGGLAEIATAALTAGQIAGLALVVRRVPSLGSIFEGLAAFVVASTVIALIACGAPVAFDVAVVAGLIVILPGMTLTIAVAEVATRHLASGVTRLAAAAVSFGSLAFGVMLARQLGDHFLGSMPVISAVALPDWTLWPAILVAPLGFAVTLRAAPRDWLAMLITAPFAFLGTRIASSVLGPEMSVFAGAFAVTAISNLLARLRDRPASVTLVPSVLVLVPGSLGLRSLSSLLTHDFTAGMDTAIRMMVVAMALVGGMLLANVVAPARRAL